MEQKTTKIILHKGYGGGLHPADFERQLAEYGYKGEDFYTEGREVWEDFLKKKWRSNDALIGIIEDRLKSGCKDYTILELPAGTDYLVHDEEGNETAYFSLNGRMYSDERYTYLLEKGVIEAMRQSADNAALSDKKAETAPRPHLPVINMDMRYAITNMTEILKIHGRNVSVALEHRFDEVVSDEMRLVPGKADRDTFYPNGWTLYYSNLPVLELKDGTLFRGESARQEQFEKLAGEAYNVLAKMHTIQLTKIPSVRQIGCLKWLSESFPELKFPQEFTANAYSDVIGEYMAKKNRNPFGVSKDRADKESIEEEDEHEI